jgi:hypothetical protein
MISPHIVPDSTGRMLLGKPIFVYFSRNFQPFTGMAG